MLDTWNHQEDLVSIHGMLDIPSLDRHNNLKIKEKRNTIQYIQTYDQNLTTASFNYLIIKINFNIP